MTIPQTGPAIPDINQLPSKPKIYESVWAVGILKPKFQPNGTVFAQQLDVIGTSFLLLNEKVLITCAHVVQNLLGAPIEITGLLVVGKNGNYTPARVSVIDHGHDLAVLQFSDPAIANKQTEEGLLIANGYPVIGDRIAYAGFPLGMQLLNERHAPTYTEGVMSSELKNLGFRKELQMSGPVTGGFSGSPVVAINDPQKVIAMVSNSPSKEAGDANIFMGISWEHIEAIAKLAIS